MCTYTVETSTHLSRFRTLASEVTVWKMSAFDLEAPRVHITLTAVAAAFARAILTTLSKAVVICLAAEAVVRSILVVSIAFPSSIAVTTANVPSLGI